MDEALGMRRRASDGQLHPKSRAVVRYADDFVVFCRSRREAEQTIRDLTGWLAERGLSLSSEKTCIVHIRQGFDFLGFNVRQYEDLAARADVKLLIRPSKASMKRICARLCQE